VNGDNVYELFISIRKHPFVAIILFIYYAGRLFPATRALRVAQNFCVDCGVYHFASSETHLVVGRAFRPVGG